MLNNRWVVIALCVAAVALVGLRVIKPIMQELNGNSAAVMASDDPFDDYKMDDDFDGGSLVVELSAQDTQLTSAQRAIRSIDVEALHWVERPARDPFAPDAEILVQARPVTQKSIGVDTVIAAIGIRWPRVSAVIDSRKHQYAVIDGSIRRPGDRFGEFVLTAIEREQIRLTHAPSRKTRQFKVETQ